MVRVVIVNHSAFSGGEFFHNDVINGTIAPTGNEGIGGIVHQGSANCTQSGEILGVKVPGENKVIQIFYS